ncbi:phosphoribosylanthranilate isomerase [Candidatus Marinamargulisbacteria bacterium SCGC AAA071-K20]|nr:phosphoribosylanthranilate isomerase [Candidatus Marinamargulisbacteria bacterium SCGC AAA071-K20]
MKTKICGITNREDAKDAIALGVDALGFIFYKDSPRFVSADVVEEIALFVPPFVQMVGVFVDHSKEEIDALVDQCRLDLIQLHGSETPNFCLDMKRRVIKAVSISEIDDIDGISQYQGIVSGMLLDTKVDGKVGGTGQSFDWGIALKAKEFDTSVILSGGINEGNIKKAIQLVNPYGIDVCSGVEQVPGKKDYNKMKAIIEAARL